MSKMTLEQISEAMRDIDICMMSTKTKDGKLESRPMSNNRDVEYKGDSYFFANGNCSAVQEIEIDPAVNLSFVHKPAIIGKPFFLSITGNAELIRNKIEMKKHWVKNLEMWFKEGIETPGLTLIHIKTQKIKYWNGWEEGEISLQNQ